MKPTAVPPTARSAVAPVPEGAGAQHRHGPEHDPEAVRDVRDLDHRRPPGPDPPRRARRCGTRRSGTRGATRADGPGPGGRIRRPCPDAGRSPARRRPPPVRHPPPSRWRCRALGHGSRDRARPRCSRSPPTRPRDRGPERPPRPSARLTSASRAAIISRSSRCVELLHRLDPRRIVHRVPLAVTEQGSALAQRLGHLPGHRPGRARLGRPLRRPALRWRYRRPTRHGRRAWTALRRPGPRPWGDRAYPRTGHAVPAVRRRRRRTPPSRSRLGIWHQSGGPPPRPRPTAVGGGCRARGAARRTCTPECRRRRPCVHPTRRGPMADTGCATATGRTKVRSAAVVAVAAWGATIPAKSTAKPDERHRHHRRHPVGRDDGAEHDEARPDDVQASVRHEPHAGWSRELHQE